MPKSVVACPNDPNDINKATKMLGCGKDIYGNSQYMCVPNQQKTELKEFCFQGTMEMFEEGNCLETSDGKLIRHSCIGFYGGCPMHPFRSSEILKYPACQAINKDLKCYSLDPSCQPKKEKTNKHELTVIMGAIIFVLVVVIFVIVLFIWIKRRKKGGKRSTLELNQLRHDEKALTGKQVKEALMNKEVKEDSVEQCVEQCRSSTQGDMAGSQKYRRCITEESISDIGTRPTISSQSSYADIGVRPTTSSQSSYAGSMYSECYRIYIGTKIQTPVQGNVSNTLPITIIQGDLIEPEKNKVFNTFPIKSKPVETTL